MNYWIEDIEQNAEVYLKMLRYRHDVDHGIDINSFSIADREIFNSYKSNKRKLEFYFTRVLWQSFEFDEEIRYKSSGKPTIEKGFVSISHSHDCIAIAFSKYNDIGIDIEPISLKIEKVKHKFSHPKEDFRKLIDLTKSWCIKEAVYKLLDLKDIIFMEDIYVKSIENPSKTVVELNGEKITILAKVIELPNDMIMAYTIDKKLY